MFNPSELEGEVDHSFFDSDDDDGSLSRDRGKQMASPPRAHGSLHAKQAENTKEDLSPRTSGTKRHLRKVSRNMNREEREESRHQSKEEARSRSSNLSSVASGKFSNSSDSEIDYKLHSNRAFLALSAEPNRSPNETEEETLPSTAKHTGSKCRNRQFAKKLKRNVCAKSPSQSSTKASVETDSESCSSSTSGRSSGRPTRPKSKKSSLSPMNGRVRETSRDSSTSHTEGSESVTDVSPLSSPDISPLQSMDLNQKGSEEGSGKEQQQEQDSVPSSGLSEIHHDENSDQTADEFSLNSESQLGGKLVFHHPGGKNRKNFSFTNDEVKRIDQENQRLLRALSRLSVGSRPGSAVGKKTSKVGKSPVFHLASSALNRQREQKRIERENLAFLKRLESVKPTSGMRRSDQLADYQRQVGYLEAPTHPMCWSPSRNDRSTHRKNTAGPRSVSSSHRSSRAVSATTNSHITPAPK